MPRGETLTVLLRDIARTRQVGGPGRARLAHWEGQFVAR